MAGLQSQGIAIMRDPNQSPVAHSGVDQIVNVPHNSSSATFTLDGSTSFDPDAAGSLTYQWSEGGVVVGIASTVMLVRAPGTYTFVLTVADPHGAAATDSVTVTVNPELYAFTGFFQPIDNSPTRNTVKAGPAVPVRFSLSGDKGLAIFDAGYPASQQIQCDTTAPLDAVEETLTAGSSTISYDPTSGRYTYVWKTDKLWVGSCRRLSLQFKDGSVRQALFSFSK
jgi:hypothetical protein